MSCAPELSILCTEYTLETIQTERTWSNVLCSGALYSVYRIHSGDNTDREDMEQCPVLRSSLFCVQNTLWRQYRQRGHGAMSCAPELSILCTEYTLETIQTERTWSNVLCSG